MLDFDLAALYRVSTKRLNEQVKRNRHRFPKGFMFRLTQAEARLLRSQFCDLKLQEGRSTHSALRFHRIRRHQRRPPASFADSGSVRNRPIATTPRAGPTARAANAQPQPAEPTSGGTSQMDAMVSAKPTHVCVVSAVPT
ncbi:MAG: ORF6N domain-containing protein [Candidatus Rokubacteria bacterium]|nr:ORF6N domain-containing protein [Candidatus Rokubacteria bacterium]